MNDTTPENPQPAGHTGPVPPPVLAGPSALSWAAPIYDAVLSPMDAARRPLRDSTAGCRALAIFATRLAACSRFARI